MGHPKWNILWSYSLPLNFRKHCTGWKKLLHPLAILHWSGAVVQWLLFEVRLKMLTMLLLLRHARHHIQKFAFLSAWIILRYMCSSSCADISLNIDINLNKEITSCWRQSRTNLQKLYIGHARPSLLRGIVAENLQIISLAWLLSSEFAAIAPTYGPTMSQPALGATHLGRKDGRLVCSVRALMGSNCANGKSGFRWVLHWHWVVPEFGGWWPMILWCWHSQFRHDYPLAESNMAMGTMADLVRWFTHWTSWNCQITGRPPTQYIIHSWLSHLYRL